MAQHDEPSHESSEANAPLRFLLATLLLVMTALAILLSFISTITFVCLCFAAGTAVLLVLVEIVDYFHRAFVMLSGIIFALIGTASLVLIGAVLFDQLEGHDAASKLAVFVCFGGASSLCY